MRILAFLIGLFAAFPVFAQNVVPVSCPIVTVMTGGTAVKAIPSRVNGAVIQNPLAATENLYINQVATATTSQSGTNFPIQPGQPWYVIPGSSFGVSVNAATSAHTFSCIMW